AARVLPGSRRHRPDGAVARGPGTRGCAAGGAGPGRRPRHQTLAHRALERAGRAAGSRRVPAGGRRRTRGPRARTAARGRGRGWELGPERGRRVLAPGNGGAACAGASRGVGGYRCHAHGHRRRHTRRRIIRTYRRAVRLLPLSRAGRGGGARARLPPLLSDGHRGLPARPPSLPHRCHTRGGGRHGGAPGRVTRATTAAEARLIGLVADAVRGPKREGLFALWLVVRSAEALLPPRPVSGTNHRRRLQALDARLASLALPGPL